ncbi:MAG: G5 domain-containing protein [Anaerolineaceae bacterium]|nr:G5 domain-containing protein [Anaerolineaceae bacterium]
MGSMTFHYIKKPQTNHIMYTLKRIIIVSLMTLLILTGCATAESQNEDDLNIVIYSDGITTNTKASIGDSVEKALSNANITLDVLDQSEPPTYSVLTQDTEVFITRIREEFVIEEINLPFGEFTVKNESLPEGQRLLIQDGKEGIQQKTIRIIYENNIEISRSTYSTEIIHEPEPQIIMVGVQTPFTALPIEGRIAYLTSGNAWIMEGNTGNRRPIITTGDLDGHIFTLSPNGQFLMFTRSEEESESDDINSLWAIDLNKSDAEQFSLKAKNVIHYAEWIPDEYRAITYSTVEPRSASPGWQANNDLYRVIFNSNETITQITEVIETNQGGDYGWWGTNYSWSPDGKRIAYARPDSIGLVDWEDGTLVPLLVFDAFTTYSNWAWVPGLGWSEDHQTLYTIEHDTTTSSILSSFNLTALLPTNAVTISMIENAGMFAYPVPSPISTENGRYKVAFLKAIFPEKSDSSRYRLILIDRDGSNQQNLFPPEDSLGLEPQEVHWEPLGTSNSSTQIGLIYQGNLYLIDTLSGESHQITGDGALNQIDWKPVD